MICPLLFFLFFLGFLAFLVDASVGVSGADSRNISDIGQGLFKICIIGGNDCFNSFDLEWIRRSWSHRSERKLSLS
jgi:hypothetical protein